MNIFIHLLAKNDQEITCRTGTGQTQSCNALAYITSQAPRWHTCPHTFVSLAFHWVCCDGTMLHAWRDLQLLCSHTRAPHTRAHAALTCDHANRHMHIQSGSSWQQNMILIWIDTWRPKVMVSGPSCLIWIDKKGIQDPCSTEEVQGN